MRRCPFWHQMLYCSWTVICSQNCSHTTLRLLTCLSKKNTCWSARKQYGAHLPKSTCAVYTRDMVHSEELEETRQLLVMWWTSKQRTRTGESSRWESWRVWLLEMMESLEEQNCVQKSCTWNVLFNNFTPWNYRVTDRCQHCRRGWTQKLLHLQRAYVYKKLPKRKTELNSLNEQCYQLAFSWQTDTIETIVLFLLENWLSNMMSVIMLFKADWSWVKYIHWFHESKPNLLGLISKILTYNLHCRSQDLMHIKAQSNIPYQTAATPHIWCTP